MIFPIGLPGNTFIQYLHKPTDIAQTGSPLFRKVMNNLKLGITQGFVIEMLLRYCRTSYLPLNRTLQQFKTSSRDTQPKVSMRRSIQARRCS
ncbi:MAG: hypothetical protein P8X79_01735 [Reinekea sp.]